MAPLKHKNMCPLKTFTSRYITHKGPYFGLGFYAVTIEYGNGNKEYRYVCADGKDEARNTLKGVPDARIIKVKSITYKEYLYQINKYFEDGRIFDEY